MSNILVHGNNTRNKENANAYPPHKEGISRRRYWMEGCLPNYYLVAKYKISTTQFIAEDDMIRQNNSNYNNSKKPTNYECTDEHPCNDVEPRNSGLDRKRTQKHPS